MRFKISLFSTLKMQGQSMEKVNRDMILAPLVGIVLNLSAATEAPNHSMVHDIARAIANIDASSAALTNFKYLLEYSWVNSPDQLWQTRFPSVFKTGYVASCTFALIVTLQFHFRYHRSRVTLLSADCRCCRHLLRGCKLRPMRQYGSQMKRRSC